MNLTLIENLAELSAAEQKALYADGADIATGAFYVVAEVGHFEYIGKDIMPTVPALRSLTSKAGISWIITNFRGKKVAFGSAS
jgi:hypothetical protein